MAIPNEINCKNLSDAEAIKVTIDFQILEKSRNKPAVYYFLIKNKIQPPIIIDNILAYKNQRKRSCPQIEKKRSIASYYLYCGSVKRGLHGRYIQHMGFGNRDTYALQLVHWAKNINLVLEFNYGWIDSQYVEFTELIESSLAIAIKPLVGKIA